VGTINPTGTEHGKEVKILQTLELLLISYQYNVASSDRTTPDGPRNDTLLESPTGQQSKRR